MSKKTKCLMFSPYTYDIPIIDYLTIHGNNCNNLRVCNCANKIYRTDKLKYLGIMLDDKLRWDAHIDMLFGRLKKLVYIFYNLRSVFNRTLLTAVYKSFIESALTYGIIVWGGTYSCVLNPIQILQKYIIKVMLFKRKRFPSDELFAEAGLLDIKGLYILKTLSFMIRNPEIRTYVDHIYNTRHRSMSALVIPRMRTSHCQKFINYTGTKLYNLLPDDFKSPNSKNLFSRKLYKFIFQNKALFNPVLS